MEWKCKALEKFIARYGEEFFKEADYVELAKVMLRFQTMVGWNRAALMLLATQLADPYAYFTQVLVKGISKLALEVFMGRMKMYTALGTLMVECPCTSDCTHRSGEVSECMMLGNRKRE